ncbi:hypothetical protein NL676_003409 [Syzygium grande]|nr:hypothetical protein NL676_003409 [Syzygium grande]
MEREKSNLRFDPSELASMAIISTLRRKRRSNEAKPPASSSFPGLLPLKGGVHREVRSVLRSLGSSRRPRVRGPSGAISLAHEAAERDAAVVLRGGEGEAYRFSRPREGAREAKKAHAGG